MVNLRVRDVAERLEVSNKTVYRWLREGVIPATRLGKTWMISENSLRNVLAPDAIGATERRVAETPIAADRTDDNARQSEESQHQASVDAIVDEYANDNPIVERRPSVGKINVAIIGVGNCASSLVQGVHKYAEVDDSSPPVPGVMHNVLGGYTIGDVNVVAAFDIDKEKVGRDINEAIFANTNNALKFHEVPASGIAVQRGMTHDGLGEYLSDVIEKDSSSTCDIAGVLRERQVDVVISYLPVGSEQATKWYVEQILAAGCAFVNCIPIFIANQPYWQKRFADKGLPIVGDDIKSQLGATIVHRVLARLFEDRGVRLDRTYQLNFGGNTDFYNMLERSRLITKKISKTQSVQSQLEKELPTDDVHIGPSDHVPWLEDRKWAYIRLEGTSWGDVPLNVELKLEVEDSPNSAGVAIDAIRCAKIALDRGLSGAVEPASAYFMKSPPVQMRDDDARRLVEEFANGSGTEASN